MPLKDNPADLNLFGLRLKTCWGSGIVAKVTLPTVSPSGKPIGVSQLTKTATRLFLAALNRPGFSRGYSVLGPLPRPLLAELLLVPGIVSPLDTSHLLQ